MSTELADIRLQLDGNRSEVTNGLAHISSCLETIKAENANAAAYLNNVVMNELLLARQAHAATAMTLVIRAGRVGRWRWTAVTTESYRVASPVTLDEAVTTARLRHPDVFDRWFERLRATEEASTPSKIGTVEDAGDRYSRSKHRRDQRSWSRARCQLWHLGTAL